MTRIAWHKNEFGTHDGNLKAGGDLKFEVFWELPTECLLRARSASLSKIFGMIGQDMINECYDTAEQAKVGAEEWLANLTKAFKLCVGVSKP